MKLKFRWATLFIAFCLLGSGCWKGQDPQKNLDPKAKVDARPIAEEKEPRDTPPAKRLARLKKGLDVSPAHHQAVANSKSVCVILNFRGNAGEAVRKQVEADLNDFLLLTGYRRQPAKDAGPCFEITLEANSLAAYYDDAFQRKIDFIHGMKRFEIGARVEAICAFTAAGLEPIVSKKVKFEKLPPDSINVLEGDIDLGETARLARKSAAITFLSCLFRLDPDRYFVLQDNFVRDQQKKYQVHRGQDREALTLIGTPAAEICVAALEDESGYVRLAGAEGLGAIGYPDDQFVPAMVRLLKDKRLDVREAGSHALISRKAKKAIPALIDALKDKRMVRVNAAQALGSMGSDAREAVPSLLQALKEKEHAFRLEAASALAEIAPDADLKALVGALTDFLSVEDREPIKKAGNVESGGIAYRVKAVQVLGKMGPRAKAALPKLLEALRLDDPDLRAAISVSLKKIDPDGDYPAEAK